MSTVFVIRNQHGLFLNRQGEWVEGREAQSLYRTVHRDEAVNSVFEASSRDITIRAEAIACEVDARGQPRVTAAASPPPEALLPGEPDQQPAVDTTADVADDGSADAEATSAPPVEPSTTDPQSESY